YAHNSGQEPKYSCTILVPKTDTATKARIDAAIEAAKQDGAQSKFGGTVPPILAIPVHDGDGTRPSDGMPFGEECKGHWVFTASSKQAPQIVDAGVNPIIDQTEVYSGMYARVSVNFFAYNSNGRKGIGCGLNNVQKLADGEPLGGRTTAAEDFGAPSGAMAPATPTYGAAQTWTTQQAAAQQPNAGQPAPAFDPITGMPLTPGV
ncbi:DUF2815 family protein, partial [Anaerovorax odorimutans]